MVERNKPLSCIWIRKRLNSIRTLYYVELLMLLFNLAQGIRASANFPSLYQKVCDNLYSQTICDRLISNKEAENRVQKETAKWLMYIEVITFVPNLLTAMFFGSFADKFNRKVPTVVSIASMVLHTFLYTLFVSYSLFPVWVMVAEAGLVAMFGSKTVFVSAQFAEAAWQTKDKGKLTQRFVVLTACISCAIFVAGNICPLLLKYCTLEWIMIIGEAVMAVTFFLAFLLHSPKVDCQTEIKERCHTTSFSGESPLALSTIEERGRTLSPNKIYSVRNPPKTPTSPNFCNQIGVLYMSAIKTLSKHREHFGRLRLFLLCIVGLFYACADSGMDTVTTLFVYHEPVSWTPSIFSQWMATMSVAQMLGSICGANLLKRMKFSDYAILMIGLASTMLKMICISVAKHTWMMYVALGVGCLSGVGVPSLRSIVAQLGDVEEIGELTSVLSVVIGWAPLISSLIFNNIYGSTLYLFTGLTFLLVAVLLFICFVIVVFLNLYQKRVVSKMSFRKPANPSQATLETLC